VRLLESETGRPALTGWAFAFVNIRAVRAVVVAALAARKLVDVLQMICAGFPGIPYHDLPVLVSESDCGCVYAFSGHAPKSYSDLPTKSGSLRSFISSLPSFHETCFRGEFRDFSGVNVEVMTLRKPDSAVV
jgi:hypothetical protein